MALTDKLGVFVEDMRRGGVDCLPPDINASNAHFTVEDGARPLCARRAQGRRREGDGGAGRGARARRAVRQPRGFRRRASTRGCSTAASSKASPARARSTRSSPTGAAVFAAAETILAHAASAHDQRDQRPGRPVRRQFGRGGADPPAARCVMDAGAAHGGRARRLRLLFLRPPGRCASAICSPRTRSGPSPSSPRSASPRASASGATMAALVEGVRWRVSAKGRRYMIASLSDRSGQFEATVFDDEPASALEAAAKSGACGLLTRRARPPRRRRRAAGDDQALPAARRPRQADAAADDGARAGRRDRASAWRASWPTRAAAMALLRFVVPLASGGEAVILAGRDYALDGELASRIERITGEGSVDLSASGAAEAGAGRLSHPEAVAVTRLVILVVLHRAPCVCLKRGNTCSSSIMGIASRRASAELAHLHPRSSSAISRDGRCRP